MWQTLCSLQKPSAGITNFDKVATEFIFRSLAGLQSSHLTSRRCSNSTLHSSSGFSTRANLIAFPDNMSALQNSGIVPDVIDDVELEDAVELEIRYPSGAVVANGNDIPKDQAQDKPTVNLKGDGLYTLLVVDPDAPSREDPKWAEFLHWMVVDWKGGAADGEEVVPYMGPAPPPGTGKHRYVFLLFRQMSPGDKAQLAKEDVDKPLKVSPPAERKNFSTKKWMKEHHLRAPARLEFFYSETPRRVKREQREQGSRGPLHVLTEICISARR